MGQRVVSRRHVEHTNDRDDFMSQLCCKTVRASVPAHGSAVIGPWSWVALRTRAWCFYAVPCRSPLLGTPP